MKNRHIGMRLNILVVCASLSTTSLCATVDAVEYYHTEFAHYFITASPIEISVLDSGTVFAGWARTGRSFQVESTEQPGTKAVCRFFSTSFAPKSSHFYTADAAECSILRSNTDWQFEAIAFYAYPPTQNGLCASGDEVYRLYNDGQGAAPNHRFLTSTRTWQEMKLAGWKAEGVGVGIGLCASSYAPAPHPTAENLAVLHTAAINWTRDQMKSPSAFKVVSSVDTYFNSDSRTGYFQFDYDAPNSFGVMLRGHALCRIVAPSPDNSWINDLGSNFGLCKLT